jgi:hypothetical protein
MDMSGAVIGNGKRIATHSVGLCQKYDIHGGAICRKQRRFSSPDLFS